MVTLYDSGWAQSIEGYTSHNVKICVKISSLVFNSILLSPFKKKNTKMKKKKKKKKNLENTFCFLPNNKK